MQVLSSVTRALAIYAYKVDPLDLPLERLSEQKAKKLAAQSTIEQLYRHAKGARAMSLDLRPGQASSAFEQEPSSFARSPLCQLIVFQSQSTTSRRR